MNRSEKGKLGEDVCAWYLEKHGYTVVARNVHSRYGEVDLIAENESYICFVEVKTRKAVRGETSKDLRPPQRGKSEFYGEDSEKDAGFLEDWP